MDHISTLLPKVLRKHGLKDEADASHIVFTAQEWLNARGQASASVTKFQDCTLFIEVQSSVDAQECHALTGELLTFLQNKFPDNKLEHIRLIRA